MNKESIKGFLNTMLDTIHKESVDLYKSLIDKSGLDNITDYESFYFAVIYPFTQYVSGLIKTEISTSDDVEFLLIKQIFIERNFQRIIEKNEGSACCVDKTRTIMRSLLNYYKSGDKIEFDYDQEYTYHLPKKVFKTHDEIVTFYEALKHLYAGYSEKYLNVMKNDSYNV